MLAKNRPPKGLTIFELLVTILALGVVVAVVIPAIGASRESARRMSCVNNLRDLGFALHSHHHANSRLPAGWQIDSSGKTAYGWAVPLLPFIGQPDLFDVIQTDLAVGDPKNRMAREVNLVGMLCPSDIVVSNFMLFESDDSMDCSSAIRASFQVGHDRTPLLRLPTSNYVGVHGTVEPVDHAALIGEHQPSGDGAFRGTQERRLRDFQRGLSHTFVVGERKMAQASSTWYGVDRRGEDATARLVGATLDGINQAYGEECDFSSRHPGGAHFLYGDGHVRLVTEQMERRLYREHARLRTTGQN